MPPVLYVVFVLGLAGVVGWLVAERRRHDRHLASIPVRVLVNGSRGKSSTTRLVAAALRADPYSIVAAKTTGTAARFIYPNGQESPIRRRWGVVNVIEQVPVVARAVKARATHLVLECMAVDPELQRLNQEVLVRGTIGVITNVREDHVDEMGPTMADIARSLAGSMPVRGVCVTAEDRYWPQLRAVADRKRTRLIFADPESVSDIEMAGFPYLTFKGNVACALVVAELCGVPRRLALSSMYAADPDPGVLRVDRCEDQGRPFFAVNVFAANDPQSTIENVALLRERGLVQPGGRISVVINCRPDRLERNGQMGAIVGDLGADRVFLIGSSTRSAAASVPAALRDRIIDIDGEHRTGEELRDLICARLFDGPGTETLVLVGNIHGRGEGLLHALDTAPTTTKVDVTMASRTFPSRQLRVPRFQDVIIDGRRVSAGELRAAYCSGGGILPVAGTSGRYQEIS